MSSAVSVERALAPGAPEASPITAFVATRLAAIRSHLADPAIVAATLATLDIFLSGDADEPADLGPLRDGRNRRREIHAAVRALARAIQPRTYLEIGTGYGWSLAQVACEAPEARVYSVDSWIESVAGPPGPGPESVHSGVCRAAPGFGGRITYIEGNSHDVLPVLFDGCHDPSLYEDELSLVRESENRPRRIDLVTVDGDNTAAGLWWDLHDVMPRIALGGAVIAADIADDAAESHGAKAQALRPPRVATPADLRPSRLDAWCRIQAVFPEFTFLDRLDAPVPFGIAVRTR